MCRPASFIITKDNVYWSKKTDSHEDIIQEFNLRELFGVEVLIVRVEISPKDGDLTTPTDSWIFRTDQNSNMLPSWYDAADAERRCRVCLPAWLDAKVVTSNRELRDGHYYVIGCDVRALSGSTVDAGSDSTVDAGSDSTVDARSGSKVRALSGSKVRAYDGSTVDALSGSKVRAYDGSTVDAHDGSTVDAYKGSTVHAGSDSTVDARSGSTVYAYNGSTVYAYNGSTVYAHNGSKVDAWSGSTVRAMVATKGEQSHE